MKLKKIKSYAKINLSLNIIGKFKSKLHKVETLITFINYFDLINIKSIKSNEHKIYFKGKFAKGIGKINTISKLLKILDSKKLLKEKFKIEVIKNIPTKAGLGGGSMNAANLISFFLKNRLIRLKKNKVIKLANSIGSDVILGIEARNSILKSNGKLIKFSKKLKYYVLVTKPNIGCSTKKIYSKVNTYSKSKYDYLKSSIFDKKNIINLTNDLEKIVLKEHPETMKVKLFLSNLLNVNFVRMTGSGSSIVAYFQSKKALDIAYREFRKQFNNYWCIKSKTI